MTNTRRQIAFTLIGSVLWAIVFIASARLLKGNPAKDWVQAILYGFGFFLMFYPVTARSRTRSC